MFFMFFIISILLITCFISACIIQKGKRIVERFVESDVIMSLFEKIPDKLLNYPISISRRQSALCMFVISNKNNKKNPVVGYVLDKDIPYLNAFQNIFDFKTKKLDSLDWKLLKQCDVLFMKVDTHSEIYNKLNSKYQVLKMDVSSPNINFWFPLSKKRKIVNNYDNSLVEVIFIPNVIINPNKISVDEEKTIIFNIHLGLDDNKQKIQKKDALVSSFNHNWWNKELSVQSDKINFQLMKYDFKEVDKNKKITLHDELKLIVGDRIILGKQNNENMNDYYYVLSINPFELKNYLPKDHKAFEEFTLIKGDRMLVDDEINIYQPDGTYVKEKKEIKKKSYHDCVSKNDYSIDTSYLTKEACESDYDVYGNKRTVDTLWFRRCKNDSECDYSGKSRNKFRGGCVNGLCDKPLMKDENILYYGSDPKDYAYQDDVYDRIHQDLRPILNI